MRPVVKKALIAASIAVTFLSVVFAQAMISPGRVIDGHAAIDSDCFACHTAFVGTSDAKCISCHKLADIGRLMTTGQPLTTPRDLSPFHEKLREASCARCHSDHVGVAIYRAGLSFSHGSIRSASLDVCEGCHKDPTDPVHPAIPDTCKDCHETKAWKPAKFDHDVVEAAALEKCLSCHRKDRPKDDLHRDVSAKCGRCHVTSTWKRSCPGFCGYKLE